MGVYPCRYCGALFISVNMSQEPHKPNCPAELISDLEVRLARATRMVRELHKHGVDLAYSVRVPFDEAAKEKHLAAWEQYVLDSLKET